MTNYEWLLNMSGEERQAWFDAEHVDANDVSTRKGDVRAGDVCANDVDVLQDSREKLEADVRKWCAMMGMQPYQLDFVYGWLDRQEKITEQECREYEDELRKQHHKRVEKLTAERDALADDLLTCNKEREEYRELFSKAITQAAEIVNLQP